MPKKRKRRERKKTSGKKRRRAGRKRTRKTKIERAVESYQKAPGRYCELTRRADTWLSENREELTELLKLHISYSDSRATYDDFKAEIHMILLLLDKDKDGFIEFEDLGSSLNQLRMLEEAKTKPPIPTIATPDRGWIKGRFYCLNCLEDANHPYHFEEMFPANTFSEGVVNIIRRHTKLCTPSIKVNQSSDEKKESELTTGLMLTDQGLEGGDEWNPKEATFYYRPSGYIASEWSPTNIPDFMALAHDPILWSKMISEIMLYEERVEKRMAKLGLREQTQCIIPLGLQRRIRVGPGELPPNIVKIILSNESQEQHEQSWILVERSDTIFNVTKLNPKSKNVQQVSSDSK